MVNSNFAWQEPPECTKCNTNLLVQLLYAAGDGHADDDTIGGERLRQNWNMFGHEVGVECLCALLGISRTRLYRCAHGEVDGRYKQQKTYGEKTMSIDRFFFNAWLQHGETIPEKCSYVSYMLTHLCKISWTS